MANFPDHMNKTEATICNKLLTAILSRGYTVSVCDGMEWTVKNSRDRALIQKETAATDCTIYRVRDNGQKVGQFYLIHGNAEDVISDYGWHEDYPDAEKIMDEMSRHAEPS